ncbi:DUF2987 domain-containing protein [Thalassomonas sp. M1454]|uniref:DUF2987 domain-containing protein n=1 Tax=Thalassomonas sp. M1454 TaxID=2594477 RepID=UPI00117BE6AE|nr:DUF2987 domain-containing protein [Thalassomonas sp. M1454]TRX56967.1 DUF2987 domain-containing protein [Thalassomonas sp. M1454]
MKKLLLAASLATLSANCFAIDIEYKGFYQRLDKIKDENLDQISMGFYLVDYHSRARCELNKATMLGRDLTPTNIEIADDWQLLVPHSEEMYDKFAFLRVEQKNEMQNCTLQMQIQAKDKTKTSYTFNELALLTEQMQELVDSFGSFLWFMMPNVSGLHISQANESNISFINDELKQGLSCQLTKCNLRIDTEQKSDEIALSFSQAPEVISPWIEKD